MSNHARFVVMLHASIAFNSGHESGFFSPCLNTR